MLPVRAILLLVAVAIVIMVAGCAGTPMPVEPTAESPPAKAQPKPRPQPVAVVVSRDLASYGDLTDELATRLDRPYQLFTLKGQTPAAIQRSVTALRPSSVVAVGRPALEVTSSIADIDLIHAQVFNPPPNHRGVDAMPPFEMQLRYWNQMAPHVQRIGVLGSVDMRGVIADLQGAAESLDMQLVRHEVTSDKEALVAFRRMVPQIDGFVFLPDPSVLSPDVIRRIISHGSRNGRQIVVYSPAMYQLGASLYVGAKDRDVAAQIVRLIENPDLQTSPLTEMLTRTRDRLAANESR